MPNDCAESRFHPIGEQGRKRNRLRHDVREVSTDCRIRSCLKIQSQESSYERQPTKLPSVLTVVTDSMPHLETAALGVWTGVGGRDEQTNEHGVSQLPRAHGVQGKPRRGRRGQIVEGIENVAATLNAATSTETTAYYARVLKADVPLALDVLSDHSRHPVFEAEEVEREKSVIEQEIGARRTRLTT